MTHAALGARRTLDRCAELRHIGGRVPVKHLTSSEGVRNFGVRVEFDRDDSVWWIFLKAPLDLAGHPFAVTGVVPKQDHGYRGSLLPGAGAPWEAPSSKGPMFIHPDRRFSIVAINSADYCGVLEPMEAAATDELEALQAAGTMDALRNEVQRLRLFDIARVAPSQLNALRDVLPSDHGAGEQRPVRIAVLHHQLLPVTATEEIKPFESLTNLGEVRRFLGSNEVDVVLHGHKHVQGLYEDVFGLDEPLDPTADMRRVIVCAAGTTGPGAGAGTEVAKLLEVTHDLPTLRRIKISSVRAPSGGAAVKFKASDTFELPVARESSDPPVISLAAHSAHEVHEQLLELFRDGILRRNVVCKWTAGQTSYDIPPTYPTDDIEGDAGEWFAGIVDWWQDPEGAPDQSWTHGERIRLWAGQTDQVVTAAAILASRPATSRAVITLLDPAEDDVGDYAVKFPAFALAHFWLEAETLHGCGFFRKQEMRYWWPINAAELAVVQGAVVTELKNRGEAVVPGSLMTHTSEAVVGDAPPKVAVPLLDRVAWKQEARLWRAISAIFDPDMPGRDDELATLIRFMWDWSPTEHRPPDGPPIPLGGLEVLSAGIGALLGRYSSEDGKRLLDLVDRMRQRNETYRDTVDGPQAPQAYGRWKKSSREDIDAFVEIIDAMREAG